MKPEIKIRKATKKDLKALIKLDIELFKHIKKFEPYLDTKRYAKRTKKEFKKKFKKKRRKWFALVAEHKKQIIGFVSVSIEDAYSTSFKYQGHIGLAFVKEKYRKKKIVSKLITAAINILKQRNIKNYIIFSHAKNIGAIKTWKSLGFKDHTRGFKKTIK